MKYRLKKKKVVNFQMANIDEIGPVAVTFATGKEDHSIVSYDIASEVGSSYILSTIMKPAVEGGKIMLVYENFGTTLSKWIKRNEFVRDGNLTIEFLQIIRCVRRIL